MSQRAFLALASVVILSATAAGCASPHDLPSADQHRIDNKTFVITGASSGFGRGIALRLAAEGANVVLAARRTAVLQEVAEEARSAGGVPLVMPTDVANQRDVERLAQAAVQRFGAVDVWINNAGVTAIGRFEDIPARDHARLIDVNLTGVIYGSHAAMRIFLAQGFGTVVNVSSVIGRVPLAYQASYSASKAGILALGRALNNEIRLAGIDTIKVTTVMPWAADTPIWEHAANYSGRTPRMPAMDDPHDVVEAIIWASIDPRKEEAIGWKAKSTSALHRVFPTLIERISAGVAHRELMEKGVPAPPTAGTLHVPMPQGTTVEGGVRARIEREDRQRQCPRGR